MELILYESNVTKQLTQSTTKLNQSRKYVELY